MIVEQLSSFFAPWASAYNDSKVLPTITESVHLVALLYGGGLAVAADRTTLRVSRDVSDRRRFQLEELRAVHRPVLIALSVLFVSGVAMAASDIATFLASPFFWLKLSLVTLLLLNGVLLNASEQRVRKLNAAVPEDAAAPQWARLRFNAQCSMVLWTATLIAGVTLLNAA